MTALLLAEEIFLLAHDDSGKNAGTLALDNGLAGALLLDLAAEQLLASDGKSIVAAAGVPSHPLLAAALAEVRGSAKARDAHYWVNRLPRALKPLGAQVGQSLVGRGVLGEQRRKVLGIVGTTRWPQTDARPERELRQRLRQILVQGTTPDSHSALLISLLDPLGLIRGLVDRDQRKQALSRATDIARAAAEATATSTAVARSVRSVQAAILLATTVPSVIVAAS